MPTKLRRAVPNRWRVRPLFVRNGVNNCYRCEFLLVFFYSFFILFYYSYGIRLQIFERLCPTVREIDHFLLGNGVNNGYRCKVLLVSFHSFFILLYYSYEICLQNFKGLRPAVVELGHRLEMWWAIATGTSSCSFFLILYSFCSSIAMKYAYDVSKGCAQPLES